MKGRRQVREAAVSALYMHDALSGCDEERMQFSLVHFGYPPETALAALHVVSAILSRLEEIDMEITAACKNWSLSRMCRMDRALLRLGAYELLYASNVPSNVAINEAVEMAKEFGSPESPRFINGVLDCISGAHPEDRDAHLPKRA